MFCSGTTILSELIDAAQALASHAEKCTANCEECLGLVRWYQQACCKKILSDLRGGEGANAANQNQKTQSHDN